jgi:multidrug efflux pump subunit AcrB
VSDHPAPPLGLAGRIARQFLRSEITPLLALAGLLMGLFAVLVTPREEEPQIDVTFANVFVRLDGASAKEIEQRVTTPLERITLGIEGVEHVYSASTPGQAMATVRFKVGIPRTEALVRLYNGLMAHQNELPYAMGASAPMVQPKSIDDVPVFAVTLWSADPEFSGVDLGRVARSLVPELQRVPGVREVNLLGATERRIALQIDPARMASYGLSIDDLQRALSSTNLSLDAGQWVADGQQVQLRAGDVLSTLDDVAGLIVGVHQGAPIFLRDVAELRDSDVVPQRYARFGLGAASAGNHNVRYPAVTLAISKKPGENAVDVAEALRTRVAELHGYLLPEQVQATVTRDYGLTAEDKALTLIKKLVFATASVVLLVLLALGRREAVVVGAAVVATLAMTLFASWAWGFTLNRVSLFALIFSIGILVDDAIVVVENIHRHMSLGGHTLTEAIPIAVDEVGGPTILATFTVIAALLPMAFVTGLMGPYMRPIPINASTGMLISLAVAFIFTPWLYRRLFLKQEALGMLGHAEPGSSRLQRLFERLMRPLLRGQFGNARRWGLLGLLVALILGSVALPVVGAVVLKMLPLDNKSEFQVIVNLPEGTALEETQRVLDALADVVAEVPEVTDYQTYAGAASPINFNGLVRQYDLRREPWQGDLQVNLVDKHARQRKSHEIALAVRGPLTEVAQRYGARIAVVEVPPGPPVLAPLVAEIYGPDEARRAAVAQQVRAVFEGTEHVVDVDDSLEAPQARWWLHVDASRAAQLGIAPSQVVAAVGAAFGGLDASWLHDPQALQPVPIRIELAPGDKADPAALANLRLRSGNGALVPVSELVRIEHGTRDTSILHKDGQPVSYVMGDVAGGTDSPLYGLGAIWGRLAQTPVDGGAIIEQRLIHAPDVARGWTLKWDGEWQVTYETFRDMGLAYSVGLVLIYLLVVAQFRSYGVPLIVMAPIPLTLIGIMPGHALLGQLFTAPSMIGMIALAGIIVRNSILLVDFIQIEASQGRSLEDACIAAAAVRAKPIALTGIAAMMGGFFIIDDPIFGGLAVSLISGILVSTILTLLVVPVVYYATHWKSAAQR